MRRNEVKKCEQLPELDDIIRTDILKVVMKIESSRPFLLKTLLTKRILRDTMYYIKGGMVWIFS